MIGQNQIVLNRDAVVEALQDYITKHMGEHQIVRGYQDNWIQAPPISVPGVSSPVSAPGICVYIEHVKHLLTGKS